MHDNTNALMGVAQAVEKTPQLIMAQIKLLSMPIPKRRLDERRTTGQVIVLDSSP